jgi:hypothetical protein
MMQGLHMDIDEQKSKTSGILFCSTIVLMGPYALQGKIIHWYYSWMQGLGITKRRIDKLTNRIKFHICVIRYKRVYKNNI